MPRYQIFQLAPDNVDRFRERAPRKGRVVLKPRDYEQTGELEADSPYEAWKRLQEPGTVRLEVRELGVGDVLQPDGEPPLLCTFWGFDPADWQDPDARGFPGSGPADAETASAENTGVIM